MGMMGKLKESQEKVKATRERLKTVTLRESSPDGLLEVTVRYIGKVTFPVVLCILVIQTNQPIEGLTLS